MKRSDMVKQIVGVYFFPDGVYKIHLEVASRILEQIEEAGMLAPEHPNPSQEVIDNCLSSNYWESEDE